MTDAVIGADEAVRLGLLSRLVADGEIQSEGLRLARTLAHGPTQSYAAIRSLVAGSAGRSLSDHLDAEAASISAAATTPTGIEGVDAFVAKRARTGIRPAPDIRAADRWSGQSPVHRFAAPLDEQGVRAAERTRPEESA